MNMRYLYMLTLFLFCLMCLISCAPTAPDTAGFELAASVAGDIVAENLMPIVTQLSALRETDTPVDNTGFEENDLFPSSHLTRDAAKTYIMNAFTAMGYSPYIVQLGQGPLTTYNVVAELAGTTKPNEFILIGSHLDAFYAGADDNGSAVAAMLETARALKQHSFQRSIRFVAFDLEEFGSVGSTRYVEAGYANDVTAAIVMDMIGYSSSADNSQDDVMGIRFPDKGDFLLIAGNQDSAEMVQKMTAMNSRFGLAKSLGAIASGDGTSFLGSMFMRSDHGLLWYKGVPAVLLTDTANFRNKNYHKSTDLPSTLNPQFLYANTRALASATALFAEVIQ